MNYLRFDKLRNDKGLTVKQLCSKVGIEVSTWYKLIQNNSTKVETLEKLAKALDKPVSYFFDEDLKIADNEASENELHLCSKCAEKERTITSLYRQIAELETQIAKRKKLAV